MYKETIKPKDFQMDYFKFGSGKKQLVIIPGLSVQSVMLQADAVQEAYKELTDDFTIYVFDRRKEPPLGYSLCEMTADTAEAIKAAGISHTSIFGASQGGMVAMIMALEYPELVDSMVLSSTCAVVTDEVCDIFDNWIQLARERNTEALYLDFGEMIYPQNVFDGLRDLFIDAAKTVTEAELDEFIIMAENMKGFDIRKDLCRVNCPVLTIGDDCDKVFGSFPAKEIWEHLTRGRAEKAADFQYYIYNGYGHAVYDTAPDFKKRIMKFLDPH